MFVVQYRSTDGMWNDCGSCPQAHTYTDAVEWAVSVIHTQCRTPELLPYVYRLRVVDTNRRPLVTIVPPLTPGGWPTRQYPDGRVDTAPYDRYTTPIPTP